MNLDPCPTCQTPLPLTETPLTPGHCPGCGRVYSTLESPIKTEWSEIEILRVLGFETLSGRAYWFAAEFGIPPDGFQPEYGDVYLEPDAKIDPERPHFKFGCYFGKEIQLGSRFKIPRPIARPIPEANP